MFPANRIPSPGRKELLGRLESIDINSIPDILKLLGKTRPMPSFVKVGANDGITGDPCGGFFLRNENWKGLLIEPVDYCVEKLRETYSDQSRFTIVQSAIGRKAERRTFYFMAKEAVESIPGLPEWYDQLGSFDRSHIAKHFHLDVEQFIVEKVIDVAPLSAILRRCGFVTPIFLHIDTEGFDFEVLKSLNFRQARPDMVLVEHKHFRHPTSSLWLSFSGKKDI